MTTKFCPRCEKDRPTTQFNKDYRRPGEVRAWCKDCEHLVTKHKTNLLKEQIYDKLGHICCKCRYSDKRALQIDHVNGGGNKEHKEIGNLRTFLKKVLADTQGAYQILCANCNWIKRMERREVRVRPQEEIDKILATSTGQPVSEGTRKRLSEAGKGRIPWNVGVPAWNKGIPRSDELKTRLSEIAKQIQASRTPEERQAIAQKREDSKRLKKFARILLGFALMEQGIYVP